MTIVLGILEGVPLIEGFILIMVFLLAGIIIMIIEVKKLNRLIKKEEKDISRFEKDIEERPIDIDILLKEVKAEEPKEDLPKKEQPDPEDQPEDTHLERDVGLEDNKKDIFQGEESITGEKARLPEKEVTIEEKKDASDEENDDDDSDEEDERERKEAEAAADKYIRNALDKGYPILIIREKLLASGWDSKKVEELLSKYKGP